MSLTNQTIKPIVGTMSVDRIEIRVKGKQSWVPSAEIDGRTVIGTGTWLKTAILHDEELAEGVPVAEPESFASHVKKARLNADIFTFAQKLPDKNPKYGYHREWDSLAAIPITSFSEWWEKRAESSVQRAVRKSAKVGVVVRLAELDDTFVQGIVDINNETAVRQNKAFWHFGKSFEAVKHENSTYPSRNIFLGAYFQDELIGFIRIIQVDNVASIIQLLTKMKHFDKRPANALIAKAVEICEKKGLSYLTYCNYIYNDPKSSLTEFKRRNGFEELLVPRYYIPLTLKGRIALRLGLHRGLRGAVPRSMVMQFLKLRGYCYGLKLKAWQKPSKGS